MVKEGAAGVIMGAHLAKQTACDDSELLCEMR